MRFMRTLEVKNRQEWRDWLAAYHASESEIWLIFQKRDAGRASLEYEAAVQEALCFGWIDSIIRKLDNTRYARKFTPRKADSKWSTANRKRYAHLLATGQLAPAGRKRPPTDRDGDAPWPSAGRTSPQFKKALMRHPAARNYFEQIASSYRRAYLAWIGAAKREKTRERRIREAVALLASGKKLGLK